MDTSKEYILMCEKAVEIQSKQIGFGDYFSICENVSMSTGRIYNNTECNTIWLPRQDQLQDMVTDKFSSREQIPCLQKILAYKVQCTKEDKNPSTWEQLWLAFVMKEKYNKTWNNEDWNVR